MAGTSDSGSGGGGQRTRIDRILAHSRRELGIKAQNQTGAALGMAFAYAHLGDRRRALDWLQQAAEERDPWTIYLKVEPAFTKLRGDPQFEQIVKGVGIP